MGWMESSWFALFGIGPLHLLGEALSGSAQLDLDRLGRAPEGRGGLRGAEILAVKEDHRGPHPRRQVLQRRVPVKDRDARLPVLTRRRLPRACETAQLSRPGAAA